MKQRRLSAIRHLVEQEPVHSQEELRLRLAGMGFVVTQATLSRDIKELGLVKRAADGAYQGTAGEPSSTATAVMALSRALGEFLLSVDAAQQLVVVKTGPGQAQLLGLAIDRARLTEVVGTLAGDDTILVVCRDGRGALAARATLERLAAEAGRTGSQPAMHTPVLTASFGDETSHAQIARLARAPATTVVAVAIDIGDGPSLSEIRARALAAGATRCHAFDLRDDFVRAVLLRAARCDASRRASTYSLGELAESLETIAGMPAVDVLGVAYHELGAKSDGLVVLCAENGVCTVAPATAAYA